MVEEIPAEEAEAVNDDHQIITPAPPCFRMKYKGICHKWSETREWNGPDIYKGIRHKTILHRDEFSNDKGK